MPLEMQQQSTAHQPREDGTPGLCSRLPYNPSMMFGLELYEILALIWAYLAGGLTVAASAISYQVYTGQYKWQPRLRFRRPRTAEPVTGTDSQRQTQEKPRKPR